MNRFCIKLSLILFPLFNALATCPIGWEVEYLESYVNYYKCYKAFNQNLTWQNAENYCEKNNGTLISILDQDENENIFSYANKALPNITDWWIGGYGSNAYLSRWRWKDG